MAHVVGPCRYVGRSPINPVTAERSSAADMDASNRPKDDEGGRKATRRASRQAARRRRRNLRIAAGALGLVVVVVLVIAAVNAFSEDPPAPSASVTIEATEFAYSPDPVLALAGEVEITFENRGQVGHELILLPEGVRIAGPAQYDESTALGVVPSIARDVTVQRTIDLDPGTYQIVCLLPGHFEAGMEADLIVSSPPLT
jgi:plastocyanin